MCTHRVFSEMLLTSDIEKAFKDIDVAVFVGAMPRREGMERKDLLSANVKIFKQQGQALEIFAKKSVKVRAIDYIPITRLCRRKMSVINADHELY